MLPAMAACVPSLHGSQEPRMDDAAGDGIVGVRPINANRLLPIAPRAPRIATMLPPLRCPERGPSHLSARSMVLADRRMHFEL